MASYGELIENLTERNATTSAPNTRVLLADGDVVSSRAILSVLKNEPGVVLEQVNDAALLPAVQAFCPDIVILDINNPVIRRAESWDSLGLAPPTVTIATS